MKKRYLFLLIMIMLFIAGCGGGQETTSGDYKLVEGASKTVYTLNSKKYLLQGEQLYCLNQSETNQGKTNQNISITDIAQNPPKQTVVITLSEQEMH